MTFPSTSLAPGMVTNDITTVFSDLVATPANGLKPILAHKSALSLKGTSGAQFLMGSLVKLHSGEIEMGLIADQVIAADAAGNTVVGFCKGVDQQGQPVGVSWRTPQELDDQSPGGRGVQGVISGIMLR